MRPDARKKWLLRAAAAALIAVTFGYTPYHLYARSGFAKYIELREDLTTISAKNDQLRADIDRLAREAEALRDDARVVERVARHELGWVKAGDLIIDLGRRP